MPTKIFYMRIQLVLLSCFIALSSCQPKDLPTQIQIGEKSAIVKLSYESTKDQIDSIKTVLTQRHNVEFRTSNIRYFEDGKLRTLNFSIHLPSGSHGKLQADLLNIQNNYYGFMYTDFNKGQLSVGQIN